MRTKMILNRPWSMRFPAHITRLAVLIGIAGSLGAVSPAQPAIDRGALPKTSNAKAKPFAASQGGSEEYVPDELLVRFRPGVGVGRAASIHAAARSTVAISFHVVSDLHLVRLPPGMTVQDVIGEYR